MDMTEAELGRRTADSMNEDIARVADCCKDERWHKAGDPDVREAFGAGSGHHRGGGGLRVGLVGGEGRRRRRRRSEK